MRISRNTNIDKSDPEHWHKKTLAKLLALIKNSRSGRTFFSNFENDKEILTQTDLNILLKAAFVNSNMLIFSEMLKAGAQPDQTMEEINIHIPGAPGNMKTIKLPILHYCCQKDHVEAVKSLLTAGADPTLKDSEGNTAMDYCTSTTCLMMLETASAIRNEQNKNASYDDVYEYEL